MLRGTKRSKIEVVLPKEGEEVLTAVLMSIRVL